MTRTSNTLRFLSRSLLAIILAGFMVSAPAKAQEKIPVGTVNGETITLDEVMQLTEELPDEYRRQPLENYFPNLVSEIANTKLAAKAALDAGLV